MAKTVGVVMTEKVVAGLLEDHKVVGELKRYPEQSGDENDPEEGGGLIELPADALAELQRRPPEPCGPTWRWRIFSASTVLPFA